MQIDAENCACIRLGEQGMQLESKLPTISPSASSTAAPPRPKAANANHELFCAAALSSVPGKIFAPAGTTSGI